MQDIALLNAIGTKMDYLNQRQRVLAQNVANADTPGYKPRDLQEVDFGSLFKTLERKNSKRLAPMETDSMHMNKFGLKGGSGEIRSQKITYENSPAGNAVVLEEQLFKTSENLMDYTMMTNLYQKQMGFFRIALGKE